MSNMHLLNKVSCLNTEGDCMEHVIKLFLYMLLVMCLLSQRRWKCDLTVMKSVHDRRFVRASVSVCLSYWAMSFSSQRAAEPTEVIVRATVTFTAQRLMETPCCTWKSVIISELAWMQPSRRVSKNAQRNRSTVIWTSLIRGVIWLKR